MKAETVNKIYAPFPVEEYHASIVAKLDSVIIPIQAIKKANVKLNERLHLLNIVEEQEYIINDYKQFALKQDSIISVFQIRLSNSNDYNEKLQISLKKQQDNIQVWKVVAIGGITFSIGSILLLILK